MDNRKSKAPHGELLHLICEEVKRQAADADVFVREKGFSHHAATTQTLFKVVGVSDLALWEVKQASFEEIAPATVKKLVAGSGKATKTEVAEALLLHIKDTAFACDDESDAVAVGVAWWAIHMKDTSNFKWRHYE